MPSPGFFLAAGAEFSQTILRPTRKIVGKPRPSADPDIPAAPDVEIVADAIVSEQHVDDLVITDHPVEFGAEITDHAYKKPCSVTLTYGWAAASPRAIAIASGANAVSTADPDFLRGVYRALLKLQEGRTLCDVFTGKRYYTSMLVQSLHVDTNKDTEHALIVRATMRQVIIARTQQTTVPDNALLADPASNGSLVNQGAQQTRATKAIVFEPEPA